MKNKKQIIIVISAILLTLFYFTYAVSITWDSAHYMSYVNILEGVLPFSSWDVVRGPVFPMIIHLSNLFFGKTVQGLLINSYIYYLIMLFFSYKILKDLLPNNKRKTKIIIFTLISIILNPIIYGYYHVLLTEFVAMTVAILSCYLSYKWLNCDQTKKKEFILYTIAFTILTIFCWFLKQPYVSTTLFPLLIAFLIKLFKKEHYKKKAPSILTLLICIICLISSISGWNKILEKEGLNTSTDRNPTNTLGNSFVTGLNCFEINYGYNYEYIEGENIEYLSNIELKNIKKHIENSDDTYVIVNIKDKNNNIVDRKYIDVNGNNLSTFESIKLILNTFVAHPILVTDSYITNYLSIIDIYKVVSEEDSAKHEATNIIDLTFVNEIGSIGMKPYSYTSNIFYLTDEANARVVNYEQFNHAPKLLNYAMLILSKVGIVLFKLIFLLLPICFLISIVKRIRTGNGKYDMIIVIFGFSLLHLMLHIATGAIIDRYIMPAYIPTFLGIILLVSLLCTKKKEVKKNEKRKNINHNSSV